MVGMNAQAWVHAYPLALLVLIPLYVALVMWIISRLSGWNLLVRRFRVSEAFYGETWSWQSARFRGWLGLRVFDDKKTDVR